MQTTPHHGQSTTTLTYTLPGVLHFLQAETRRFERDRNCWEIEKTEYKARIALLEGERRGIENAKTDLLRRVKMLEYALRQERSKYMAGTPAPTMLGDSSLTTLPSNEETGKGSSIPPNVCSATISSMRGPLLSTYVTTQDAKTRTTRSRDLLRLCLEEVNQLTACTAAPVHHLPGETCMSNFRGAFSSVQSCNATHDMNAPVASNHSDFPSTTSTSTSASSSTTSSSSSSLSSSFSNSSNPPSSLTSMPKRTGVVSNSKPADATNRKRQLLTPSLKKAPVRQEQQQRSQNDSTFEFVSNPNSTSASSSSSTLSEDTSRETTTEEDLPVVTTFPEQEEDTNGTEYLDDENGGFDIEGVTVIDAVETSEDGLDETPFAEGRMTNPSGGLQRKRTVLRSKKDGDETGGDYSEVDRPVTGKDLEEQYNISPDKVDRVMKNWEKGQKRKGVSDLTGKIPAQKLDELASLSLIIDDDEDIKQMDKSKKNGAATHKLWRTKFSLRSHLDTVRSVAFHQTQPLLISGGDDCTVKLWNLSDIPKTRKGVPLDVEPVITYRGHTEPVTSIAVCAAQEKIYSGSVDSSIRVWRLPVNERATYGPYDSTLHYSTYVGHTDAIWDVRIHPLQHPGGGRLLASSSADGSVKIWETEVGEELSRGVLKGSFTHSDVETSSLAVRAIPTGIDFCPTDARRLAIAYSNSGLRLVDVETGQVIVEFESNNTYDGTPATQINCVVAHPTLPLLITGHEDRYIRFFDMTSGQCTHSMVGHLDSVASLDIDSGGLVLASGGRRRELISSVEEYWRTFVNFFEIGHDSSIRFWDLSVTGKSCVQEFASHRRKGAEGVCSVRYTGGYPLWLASGGGDSVVKVYGYT